MNCCVECFKDIHIRNTIKKYGITGDCDFCSSKGVRVYDIVIRPNPIADIIIGLVQIYSVSDSPEAKLLKYSLHDDWDIFNAGAEMVQTITIKLCDSAYPVDSEIFSKRVIIPQLTDKDFLREFGVVRGLSWSRFADSIKYENRFHSGMFNADAFASFLSIVVRHYAVGTEFFRARIAPSKVGFPVTEMSTPPNGHRSAGRINPDGIGILYLSSDDRTVLNEIRANTSIM